MKSLIVEDDFTSRIILNDVFAKYGPSHSASNGKEAFEAFSAALLAKDPYHIICLDIVLPDINGSIILKKIRNFEKANSIKNENAVKIIMTTSIGSKDMVLKALKYGCNAYMVKPIQVKNLLEHLQNFKLTEGTK